MKEEGKPNSGNIYDRIFKENAEAIFFPLIQLVLNINIQKYKPLPTNFTKTMERSVDFLYEVTLNTGDIEILHLEFQTRADKSMLLRMGEYHGLIYRDYPRKIHHIVIYLSSAITKMETTLPDKHIFSGYQLIKLHELNTKDLLASQVPEIIILALLSKNKKEDLEKILRSVIIRLKKITKSQDELQKYLNQLQILSNLRKFDCNVNKIIENMNLGIELPKDSPIIIAYEEGIEEGIEKGIEKGIEGFFLNTNKNARQISIIFDVSLSIVQKIRKKLIKEGNLNS